MTTPEQRKQWASQAAVNKPSRWFAKAVPALLADLAASEKREAELTALLRECYRQGGSALNAVLRARIEAALKGEWK